MKRTPQAKIIRRALGLSQEDFAARYHIPLGTLRDWEQGRVEPDQAARAYLTVIAREPETCARRWSRRESEIREGRTANPRNAFFDRARAGPGILRLLVAIQLDSDVNYVYWHQNPSF